MRARLPDGRLIEIDVLWCWNDLCQRVASEVYHADGNDYPLCDRCAAVFDLGTMLGSDVHAVPVREYIEELPHKMDPEDYPDFVCWWEEDDA